MTPIVFLNQLKKRLISFINKYNCPTCKVRTIFLYKIKTLRLHDIRGCPSCKNKFIF